MIKYRAVLMVPTIVEFESSGDESQVSEQAQAITKTMGKTTSSYPDYKGYPYEPKLVECCSVD